MSLADAGACASDYDKFCPAIKPGEGRFAECLTKQLHEEEMGNVQGEESPSSASLSKTCPAKLIAPKRISAGLAWSADHCQAAFSPVSH